MPEYVPWLAKAGLTKRVKLSLNNAGSTTAKIIGTGSQPCIMESIDQWRCLEFGRYELIHVNVLTIGTDARDKNQGEYSPNFIGVGITRRLFFNS